MACKCQARGRFKITVTPMTSYFNSFIKKIRDGARPNPSRDWGLLIILFVAIFIIIVVSSIVTFQKIINGDRGEASAKVSSQVFDRSATDTLRTLFEQRAVEVEKYKIELH